MTAGVGSNNDDGFGGESCTRVASIVTQGGYTRRTKSQLCLSEEKLCTSDNLSAD